MVLRAYQKETQTVRPWQPLEGEGGFVEPMLLLKTEKLPEGLDWLYEITSDGFQDTPPGGIRIRHSSSTVTACSQHSRE
jgi:hypothetical protein